MSESMAGMRKSYERGNLRRRDCKDSPLDLFLDWFELAKENVREDTPYEANAMVLSTVDAKGFPHARVVLLKGVEHSGFVFFTNYLSNKGRELSANPNASLVFWWPDLERQVRIEGVVTKITTSESDEYFLSRPIDSQIGAHVSNQSEPIESARALEEKLKDRSDFFKNNPLERPEYWGGYILKPKRMEFWQGRPSRLHDRFLYEKCDNQWQISRLQP